MNKQDNNILGTKLDFNQEKSYQQWKSKLPKNLQYEGNYDLRGFYKENPNFDINNSKQHLTDKYKLPNHPTFSNESIYYNNKTSPQGGYWKDNVYRPNDPLIKNQVDETMKKKYGGKLAKYPMGGETKTPEQIQYEEYLARNNQTVAGAKNIENQQNTNISNNQNQMANIDTGNQIATSAISQTPWGGLAMGARDFGEGLIKKKTITDPNGYVHQDYANDTARHEGAALRPYHEYVMDDISTAGKTGKAKDYGQAALSILGLNTIKDTFGYGRKSTVKDDLSKQNYATQKAQDDELKKQQQFGVDKSALVTYGVKGNEGDQYYNAKGGKMKYTHYDGTNKGYVMAEGGETENPLNPTPMPIVSPTYNTQQRLKYPIYHQRIVNGQPTYWKGQFEGTPDEWKKAGQNTMPYVPHAEPITLDEYNKNLGTGNMMKTYTTNALGGEMKKLASDTHLAQGDTHEQDSNNDGLNGITLTNKQGQPYAEIENNEVTKNNKVYSDRIMISNNRSIANEAEKLGKEKGKYESFLNNSDSIKKATAQRNIRKSDLKLANLYNFQESVKNNNSEGNYMAYGGDTTDFYTQSINDKSKQIPQENGNFDYSPVNTITPQTYDANGKPKAKPDYGQIIDTGYNLGRFADNIVNSRLTNKTSLIPKPHLQQAQTLDTKINIEPALNESRTDYSNFAKNIDENSSNTNTGFANKQIALAEKFKSNNQLYGNKANTETQLRNENAMNNQAIAGSNLAKLDQYDMEKYNRDLMIKGEKSANIANAVEDFGNIGTERSQRKLDDQTINNTLKLYSENDAAAYKGYDNFYDSAKRTGKLNDLRIIMSKSSSGKEKWNKDPRNKGNEIR